MSDGYVKLFGSIVHSTVWREPDHVRIVWITLLAMKSAKGTVSASIPGLADLARVTIAQCEDALRRFMAPDPYSRTKDNEGRRIAEIDGGWKILNHLKYRDTEKLADKQTRDAARMREKRSSDSADIKGTGDTSPETRDVADPDPDPDPCMDPASRAQPFTLTSDPPKKPGRKRPARVLDPAWKPDETAQKLARELRLDVAREVTRFTEWHSARGSVFADWQAAFRMWLRKSREYLDKRNPTPPTPPTTPARLAPSKSMQAFDPAEFERVKKGAG